MRFLHWARRCGWHGAVVGTLCLADPQPRRLDVYERGILRALRDLCGRAAAPQREAAP
ncbi:MAG: hypothetical protein U1E77_03090 [Inhella sp.]